MIRSSWYMYLLELQGWWGNIRRMALKYTCRMRVCQAWGLLNPQNNIAHVPPGPEGTPFGPLDCQKSPPQEFSPNAKINFNHFFGGVYVEKVLCGPNSARTPFSKKWRSHFFDTQEIPRSSRFGGFSL